MIEAHADEISWFVNYITDEGYIYVRRNGGSDHQIAPSMRVNIQTDKGIVKGVFGWPAIHVRDAAREETPSLKNIFVDIGAANKKEVEEMGVHVGCVMTFEADLIELNKNFLVGRALDNRMGGFMIAEVARRLKENKKKTSVWSLCCERCTGGDRTSRCRNDLTSFETRPRNCYRCYSRHAVADVQQERKW